MILELTKNKMEDNETTNPVKKIIWKKGIKTIDIWNIKELEKINLDELFPGDVIHIQYKKKKIT